MDIRVGDKITGKWLDNNQIVTEVINSMEPLDLLISNIRNKNIEILKIERPVYEEVDSDGIHIEENEVIYERKELLTKEERYFLKLYIKLNTDFQEEKINYIYIISDNFLHFNYGQNYDYEIEICKDMFSNLSKEKTYTLSELGLEEN